MYRPITSTAALLVVGLAPAAHAATFTVDTFTDASDANPGDGVCLTSFGRCALRAAVQEADARPGYDRIVLGHGTYRLGLGALPVRSDVDIVGSGSGVTFIEAGTSSRVLSIDYDEVLVCGTDEVDRYDLFGNLRGQLVHASHGVSQATNVTRTPTRNELLVSGLSSGVHRYDARTGAFLGTPVPSNGGGYVDASSGFVGQTEVLYVAQSGFLGGLFRYDFNTGALLGSSQGGGLSEASALLAYSGFGVASFDTDAVLGFGEDGQFERVLAAGGGLSGPTDAIRGHQGFLVASWYSNEILAYDYQGTPQGAFVSAGSGGLDGPVGMVITPTDELLVVSWNNNRILRYDIDTGAFLGVFLDGAAAGIPRIRCVASVPGLGDGQTVRIERVTVRGGRQNVDYGTAGGIYIDPGVVVDIADTVVTDHEARTLGAAIRNHGNLSLLRSTVSHSRITQTQTGGGITASGGGIMNAGTLLLDRSTIHDNEATRGAGLANLGGDATIVNCTISGNRAITRGGGILNIAGGANTGGLRISYSTIANNEANTAVASFGGEAQTGGGIHNVGEMAIANAIVADNDDHRRSFEASYSPDCAGPNRIDSYGGNVIGVVTRDCDIDDVSYVGTPRDDVGSASAPLDAELGLLAWNAGATMTHAIAVTSPAVDNMVPTSMFRCPGPDQRGFTRRTSRLERCDAGAYDTGARPVFDPLPPFPIPIPGIPPWNTPIDP
ncbi:MAG: choice-of-anchor Q domain-containing protein [Deltaproteobacteria bacterium]